MDSTGIPDRPPLIEPVMIDIEPWANTPLPAIEEDGLALFLLHPYDTMESRVNANGLGIKMVAARGAMVTASVAKES